MDGGGGVASCRGRGVRGWVLVSEKIKLNILRTYLHMKCTHT